MNTPEIDSLLAQLNDWEQKYGLLGGGKSLASSGEAVARISELKRLLREQDVVIEWNGAAYIIVSSENKG